MFEVEHTSTQAMKLMVLIVKLMALMVDNIVEML